MLVSPEVLLELVTEGYTTAPVLMPPMPMAVVSYCGSTLTHAGEDRLAELCPRTRREGLRIFRSTVGLINRNRVIQHCKSVAIQSVYQPTAELTHGRAWSAHLLNQLSNRLSVRKQPIGKSLWSSLESCQCTCQQRLSLFGNRTEGLSGSLTAASDRVDEACRLCLYRCSNSLQEGKRLGRINDSADLFDPRNDALPDTQQTSSAFSRTLDDLGRKLMVGNDQFLHRLRILSNVAPSSSI